MTLIGSITIDVPVSYRRDGYAVQLRGSFDDAIGFNELRELYAKADSGTAIIPVHGERPLGEDLTDARINTQYCIFTHGTTGKVQDGFYLLRRSHAFVEDRSPGGHHYVWTINLYFLGTAAYYQDGFRLKGLDEVTNDWEAEVEVAANDQFFEAPNPDSNIGTYDSMQMLNGVDVTIEHKFRLPNNWTNTWNVYIEVIPEASGNLRRTITTNFCAPGEVYNIHSDSIAAGVQAVTLNEREQIDITAALTGASAGDLVGVRFLRDSSTSAADTVEATVHYLGILLEVA